MEKDWIAGASVAIAVLVLFFTAGFLIKKGIARQDRGATELDRAYRFLDERKFPAAIEQLSAALRQVLTKDQRASAFANRGWAEANLGHDAKAIEDFTAALRLRPAAEVCLLNRALCSQRLGRMEEALADYARVIALAPGTMAAYQNRALLYLDRGDWKEAAADLRETSRCAPHNPFWLVQLGLVALRLNDLVEARERCSAALRIDPECPEAYRGHARVDTLQNHPERGLAEVQAALEKRPDSARLHFARGLILFDAQRPDLAVDDFDAAVRLDPRAAMAFTYRGLMQFLLRKNEAAISDAEQAARLAPRLPLPWFVAGIVRDAQQLEGEAIAAFDRAIACDREFAPAVAARALAEAHDGEYEQARKDLEQAAQRFPGNDEVHRVRAIFLASCPEAAFRDGRTALAEAKLAVDLSERRASSLDALGIAYAEVGDFEDAVATAAAALERTPAVLALAHERRVRLEAFERDRPYRDVR